MLCYAVLAILLLQYANASSCPSGYDIQSGDLCYRAYNSSSSRSDASLHCSKDGGRLASIHSAFTNALILDLANYVGADCLWIGLICPDANAANCVWDDGQVGADRYSVFYQGDPDGVSRWFHMRGRDYGDSAGKWVGNTYDDKLFGHVCEVSTRDSASIMDLARNSSQH